MLRTNLSAWALRFGERGGNFTDSTPTPASRLKNQDSIDRVGGLAPDLTHPQAVGGGGDPRDLDLTRRQIEEEQDHEALQSFSRPHFHGEKIGRHDPFPVSREKLFPGRLPTALGCGFEAMPCEPARVRDGTRHLAGADSPKCDSLRPGEPPRLLCLAPYEDVRVRAGHCHRISGQ
jgi:hypothetical protein